MRQYKQVIKVMQENGGFATLGFLYQNVDVSSWKTKTPYASIRRIVQDNRFFFRIRPGLWALNDKEAEIIKRFEIYKNDKAKEFTHYYYQGLVTEIGNIKGYQTYIPPQDKNKLFLNKKLKEVAYLNQIYNFSYPEIVQRAKTIDVIWFNSRKLPSYFFEIEHSTDFQNSLLKFFDLQDYYAFFFIISSSDRKKEFYKKLNLSAFAQIKKRIKFVDYDYITQLHAKSFELNLLGEI